MLDVSSSSRAAKLTALFVGVAVAVVLGSPHGEAAIDAPAAGSTVSGIAALHENVGAPAGPNCLLLGFFDTPPFGTINVYPNEAASTEPGGTLTAAIASGSFLAGPGTVPWTTTKRRRGRYRLQSTKTIKPATGTTCTTQVITDNYFVNVQNFAEFANVSGLGSNGDGGTATVSGLLRDLTTQVPVVQKTTLGSNTGAPANALPRATIAVASSGAVDFPTSAISLTVVSTAGPQAVACTGRTASSFTGCSGGTGTIASGNAVTGAGKTITVTLAGVTNTIQADPATGQFSTTFDASSVAGGNQPVHVAFAQDAVWDAATTDVTIPIRGQSSTVYTGDTTVFWNEPAHLSATATSTIGGTAVTGGSVTFNVGTVAVTVPVNTTTGVAETTVAITDAPLAGAATYQIKADYSGDDLFSPSKDYTKSLLVKPRPTAIAYSGTTSGAYGDVVNLEADLTDVRSGAGLAGKDVTFSVGGITSSAVTDSNGHAYIDWTVSADVGDQPLSATYSGESRYVGSTATGTFTVGFPLAFGNDQTASRVYMSPGTHQFMYTEPNSPGEPPWSSGIKTDPHMIELFTPVSLGVNPLVLPWTLTLPQDWNILHVPNLLGPPTPGLDMSMPSNDGSPSVSGLTVRDVIELINTSQVPTSMSACVAEVGGACEPRFVVMVYSDSATTVIGVFDTKTRAFVAVGSQATTRLSYTTGNCLHDLVACLSLPALPASIPGTPQVDLPQPNGLIQAVAQLPDDLGVALGLGDLGVAPVAPVVLDPIAATADTPTGLGSIPLVIPELPDVSGSVPLAGALNLPLDTAAISNPGLPIPEHLDNLPSTGPLPSTDPLPPVGPLPTLPPQPGAPIPVVTPLPAVPALPDLNAKIASLKVQLENALLAAGILPDQLYQTVFDLSLVPADPIGVVTGTIDAVVERLATTALFDDTYTGIFDSPEVSVGNVQHTYANSAKPVSQTVRTCVEPDRSAPPCTLSAAPDLKQLVPQYHVSTSPYLPRTLNYAVLNPAILAPVALPAPAAGTLKTSIYLATHYGASKLVNVQGGGWTTGPAGALVPGGKHSAGVVGLLGTVGNNVDTAPRPTTSPNPPATLGDPWLVYLPLVTTTSTLPDTSIDFLGFASSATTAVAQTVSCGTATSAAALVDGVSMTTYTATCSSSGSLTGDGVATYNGSPVDFQDDLAPLWGPAPPPAATAAALIDGIVSSLLTGVAVPGLPAVPKVTGVPQTTPPVALPSPLPSTIPGPIPPAVPAVPAVPSDPTTLVPSDPTTLVPPVPSTAPDPTTTVGNTTTLVTGAADTLTGYVGLVTGVPVPTVPPV